MPQAVRYLTYPQVLIEPLKDVRRWSLNAKGREHVTALAARLGVLSGTRRVVSSDETKAIETASPIARALGVTLEIRPGMHENDRSATGFLAPSAFEIVANQFFDEPTKSVRGWETAQDAQRRILAEVEAFLAGPQKEDVFVVGHGGVGTLLFCVLWGDRIDRRFDQGPGGGGCWSTFHTHDRVPRRGWQPMEVLMRDAKGPFVASQMASSSHWGQEDKINSAGGPYRSVSTGLALPCRTPRPDVRAWRGEIVGSQSALRTLLPLPRTFRRSAFPNGYVAATLDHTSHDLHIYLIRGRVLRDAQERARLHQ